MTDNEDGPDKPHSNRDGRTLARVRSVSRAVAILRTFSAKQPFLTLSEISQLAGLDAKSKAQGYRQIGIGHGATR